MSWRNLTLERHMLTCVQDYGDDCSEDQWCKSWISLGLIELLSVNTWSDAREEAWKNDFVSRDGQ